MTLNEEIAGALEELEGVIHPTEAPEILFYIAGSDDTVTVPCVPGMLTESDRVVVGGFESLDALVVRVRTGHFLSADNSEITVDSDLFTADNSLARPRADRKCLFRGKTYRILSAGEDASRAYLRLTLGDPNR